MSRKERYSGSFLALVGVVASTGCADVRPPLRDPSVGAPGEKIEDTMLVDAATAPRGAFANASGPSAKHAARGVPATWSAPREDGAGSARPAVAGQPFLEALPALASTAPATRYAALTDGACTKEVSRRNLAVAANAKATRGVAAPMRITGPLHGVRFVTPSSPNGVLDCRLALALDDLSETLAKLGVATVRIDNFYREGAHLPGKKKKSQHASALAADITSIELADGRALTPEDDWHAPIGSTSCGPDAVMNDPTPETITLRNLVCQVAREGLFHHLLTPSFNAAHRTHFHFDIQAEQTRQSMR